MTTKYLVLTHKKTGVHMGFILAEQPSQQETNMRNFHKLLELHNNGVHVSITNRYPRGESGIWNISADKSADGICYSVDRYYPTIEDGIDDLYTIWRQHTQTMPEHRLAELEFRPFNPVTVGPPESATTEPATPEPDKARPIPADVYFDGNFFRDAEGQTMPPDFQQFWAPFSGDFPGSMQELDYGKPTDKFIPVPKDEAYYVMGEGFFDVVGGYSKGQEFYDKWNTRWIEFPQKTMKEHRAVINARNEEIPF